MTSKQIMLTLSLVALVGVVALQTGCQTEKRVDTVKAPYESRQVFAVAPLRNESGSAYANGVALADKLTYQLSLTKGIDTLPVNRVLAAMDALGMTAVTNKGEAIRLRQTLGVDGLVVGTVSAYDPYEPPKLGLSLELYLDPKLVWHGSGIDTRQLSRAATDPAATMPTYTGSITQPVSAISGHYDAADPNVDDLLVAYAAERGPDHGGEMTQRRYRISIDLYSEFVSYQLTARLMDAERLRLRRPNPNNTVVPAPQQPTSQSTAYGHPAVGP